MEKYVILKDIFYDGGRLFCPNIKKSISVPVAFSTTIDIHPLSYKIDPVKVYESCFLHKRHVVGGYVHILMDECWGMFYGIKKHNFNPEFTIIEKKQQQINKLSKAIQSSSEVYIATDDDREGEAIGWHICQLFNLPVTTTKRIIFHEITKPALEHAVNNPTTLNMDLVYAQQARQILDLIVGFTLSPLL